MLFLLFLLLHLHLSFTVLELYWHRGYAHRLLKFSKVFEHFTRFIIFTTGWCHGPNWLKEICAVHRLHHAKSDTVEDLHSPHFMSVKTWLFNKYFPFNITPEQVLRLTKDVPYFNDKIQKIYDTPYLGILFTGVIYFYIFGLIPCILSMLVMHYFPRLYQFSVTYLTHKYGYKNQFSRIKEDKSVNIFPIGIFLAGQELHANHHNYPNKINLKIKWYEFDLGYFYIIIFARLKLLKINKSILNNI
jgi:fatty-acid desaturase